MFQTSFLALQIFAVSSAACVFKLLEDSDADSVQPITLVGSVPSLLFLSVALPCPFLTGLTTQQWL